MQRRQMALQRAFPATSDRKEVSRASASSFVRPRHTPYRSAKQSRLCGLISNCFPSEYFFLDINSKKRIFRRSLRERPALFCVVD
jgi:hypothetical protein